MSNPRLLPALAVGLSALLLSGCAGSASPGVAATVGDETISTSRINEATGHLCTALADRFEAGPVPLGFIRQGVVQYLTLRSQSEQIADDYGVSPSAVYRRAVADSTRNASLMPEEIRADYVEVTSSEALFTDVREQVGRAELEAQGIADPSVDDVIKAGADVFATWPASHGIEVDPKYGIALVDGAMTSADTNLSFAVSDEAKAGTATKPDPAYAGSLPNNQRCGG